MCVCQRYVTRCVLQCSEGEVTSPTAAAAFTLALTLFLSFITRSLVRLRVWLDSLTVVTRVLVLICLAFFSSHLSLNEKAKAIEIQGQG